MPLVVGWAVLTSKSRLVSNDSIYWQFAWQPCSKGHPAASGRGRTGSCHRKDRLGRIEQAPHASRDCVDTGEKQKVGVPALFGVRRPIKPENPGGGIAGRCSSQVADGVHAAGHDACVFSADVKTACPGRTHRHVIPEGRDGRHQHERPGGVRESAPAKTPNTGHDRARRKSVAPIFGFRCVE